ncbi:hypothetical protein RUM44_002546 [Polyplax serrata]|uniref:Chitin-binding type-2 domain-containing protein n=1 Tax=Polyplax serrata TaxID=468196 RepID=A0ABR1AF70_POLSC
MIVLAAAILGVFVGQPTTSDLPLDSSIENGKETATNHQNNRRDVASSLHFPVHPAEDDNYPWNSYSPQYPAQYNDHQDPDHLPVRQYQGRKKSKYPSKHACKQYLEFLRYAFSQLDDDSTYDDMEERVMPLAHSDQLPQMNVQSISSVTFSMPVRKTDATTMPNYITTTESRYETTLPSTKRPTPDPTTVFEMIGRSLNFNKTTKAENATKTDGCCDTVLPCPDTYNVSYPLNGYCDRYVSCESGMAIRRTCPDGLHFNIITKSCDLPHNSFCNYACPKSDGYFGIPGDCGGYFVCKNSASEYRMCPPKMHWNVQSDTCTFAESSDCSMRCSVPNEVFPYKGDCSAYVICLNSVPYYHRCPPNTKFDGSVLTCVPKNRSNCEDNPKLMTKVQNPSHLCRDIHMKLGSQVWCNYGNTKEEKKFLEH